MRVIVFLLVAALLVWYCIDPYLKYRKNKKQ
jgi:hypothetical protein